MEFEDVSAKVVWEARRIAAAFGVEKWQRQGEALTFLGVANRYLADRYMVLWQVDSQSEDWLSLSVGYEQDPCEINFDPVGKAMFGIDTWFLRTSIVRPEHNELMARGLYRLGFEDESVLTELNYPLSAHEKLELRLSLPREFWPKKWLDEEEAK